MRIKVTYNPIAQLLIAYSDHGRTRVSRPQFHEPSAVDKLLFASEVTGRELQYLPIAQEYETICRLCDTPTNEEVCRPCYEGQEQPDLPEA